MIGQAHKIIWAGGEHEFKFAIGEMRALEKLCDAGTASILLRLLDGTWKIDDIIHTLRIGLQGGGLDEREAMRTIENAYPVANLYELSVVAATVLAQFVSWPTGKGEDEPEGEKTAPTNASPSVMDGPAGQTTSVPLQ